MNETTQFSFWGFDINYKYYRFTKNPIKKTFKQKQ